MNKDRRKRIGDIVSQLESIKMELDGLEEEEREAYDNMPESLQFSARGEAMTDGLDNITEASSSIDDAISYLQTVIE